MTHDSVKSYLGLRSVCFPVARCQFFRNRNCAAVRLQSGSRRIRRGGKLEAGAFLFTVGGDLSIGGFEAPPPPGVLDRIAPVEAERSTARVRDAEAVPPRPTVSRALIRAPEGENRGKGDLGNRVRLRRDVHSPATRARVDHPGRGTARRRRHPGTPSVATGVHGGDAAEHHQHDVSERPLRRPRADPNLQKRRGRDATPPVSRLGPSTDRASSIPSPRQQQPP